MTQPFATRFAAARAKYCPVVLGADPHGPLLAKWGLPDNAEGLDRTQDQCGEHLAVNFAIASLCMVSCTRTSSGDSRTARLVRHRGFREGDVPQFHGRGDAP